MLRNAHVGNYAASVSNLASALPAKRTSSPENEVDDTVDSLDSQVTHQNQPYLPSIYQDPKTMQQMLIVVASLPAGTDQNFVQVSLVGNGPGSRTVRIEYPWPSLSFNIDKLFASRIEAGTIENYHPKILALKKDLQLVRDHIDETPKGAMELTLPISVQTAAHTFSHWGMTDADGSRVLVMEFMAYQAAYTIKHEDKRVKFEICK